MKDVITLGLAKRGFNVHKYVPYGPIKEVIPYLVRRAQENSGFMGDNVELQLLTQVQMVVMVVVAVMVVAMKMMDDDIDAFDDVIKFTIFMMKFGQQRSPASSSSTSLIFLSQELKTRIKNFAGDFTYKQ